MMMLMVGDTLSHLKDVLKHKGRNRMGWDSIKRIFMTWSIALISKIPPTRNNFPTRWLTLKKG
jgi:hypothetical protein